MHLTLLEDLRNRVICGDSEILRDPCVQFTGPLHELAGCDDATPLGIELLKRHGRLGVVPEPRIHALVHEGLPR